jgi:hypothetical protein
MKDQVKFRGTLTRLKSDRSAGAAFMSRATTPGAVSTFF